MRPTLLVSARLVVAASVVAAPGVIALSVISLTACPAPLPQPEKRESQVSQVRGEAVGDPLEGFFDLAIHDVAIEVDAAGLAALLDAPRVPVPAAVTLDGERFDRVGLRLKGAAGSFVALDGDYPEVSEDGNGAPGKSAFIVDLDRYDSGQSFHGIDKLVLNNLNQDPTGVHEYLGYALFRAAGVAACRATWGSVTLNGEAKGLYALLESPDNSNFLERYYGTSAGTLFEGAYGVDLREEAIYLFDHDHGRDDSRLDLRALVAALDAVGPEEDPLPTLEARLDLDTYLAFATVELYLGHWDGYAWSANNYFVHHDPDTDRWSFLPWGIDQLFEAALGPHRGVMAGPGPSWNDHGGRVHALCLRSPGCRARLADAFEAVLVLVEEVDLVGSARAARALVEPVLLEEARRFGDPGITAERLDAVMRALSDRGGEIEEWLPCLVGGEVDLDGDGHDGCTVDCADREPEVHPGAIEQCNFHDDDCNGVLDDPVECPRCLEETNLGGASFALCHEHLTWPDARQACLDRGGDLASLHDPEVHEVISWRLLERFGSEWAWFGLSDRDDEGSFLWSDGTALDYTAWIEESPHRGEEGDAADCVVTAPWGWIDMPCSEELPYVCRQP